VPGYFRAHCHQGACQKGCVDSHNQVAAQQSIFYMSLQDAQWSQGQGALPAHLHCCNLADSWRPRLQLVLTTKDQASAAEDALPVSYERLPSMVEVGDEIFLGRYLVTGAEEASLFLEVRPAGSGFRIQGVARSDMVCPQQPAAV
jgi:hypothetical protein